MKKQGFRVSPAYIGSFCIEKFGIVSQELTGVHRYGFSRDRSEGYIKIKTKGRINVNGRFGSINGAACDDNLEMRSQSLIY